MLESQTAKYFNYTPDPYLYAKAIRKKTFDEKFVILLRKKCLIMMQSRTITSICKGEATTERHLSRKRWLDTGCLEAFPELKFTLYSSKVKLWIVHAFSPLIPSKERTTHAMNLPVPISDVWRQDMLFVHRG